MYQEGTYVCLPGPQEGTLEGWLPELQGESGGQETPREEEQQRVLDR